MKYIEITPEHRYIASMTPEDRADMNEPAYKHERTFHPAGRQWPLYSVAIWTPDPKGDRPQGFTLSVNRKEKMTSWWEQCDLFNPIPFELLPEILRLMNEVLPK